jgi:hypothetical protein
MSSSNDPDWASQLVDTFESAVGAVRSKTSEPATRLVKYLVFAVMGSAVGMFLFALLIVGTIRLLDNYLPQGVWVAYFILSGIFLLLGALLWRKRRLPAA